MRLLAPAKINLYLRVGKPRADGFHPVVSWMCTVGLFDTLIFDRSRSQGHSPWPSQAPPLRDGAASLSGTAPGPPHVCAGIDLVCDPPGLPCDAGNLVAKAAVVFAGALVSATGRENVERAAVTLRKHIPVGAGLGGGSSDGARTLEALNILWKAGWPRRKLAELSATLGSDLPFFFHGPSAVCRGRGEVVQGAAEPRPRTALLILPGRPMPTPPVYRKFDELNLGSETSQASEPDWTELARLDAPALLAHLVNDLEPAAFAIDPPLGDLRAEAEQILSRPVRMSGSGSSLFTLYDAGCNHEDTNEANRAAQMIIQRTAAKAIAVELAPRLPEDLNGPTPSE